MLIVKAWWFMIDHGQTASYLDKAEWFMIDHSQTVSYLD